VADRSAELVAPVSARGRRSSPFPLADAERTGGFTLVESLVALVVLSFGLALGLGAVAQARYALDLADLQLELDSVLDGTHEILRARRLDVETLAELGNVVVDPHTLHISSIPSEVQVTDPGSEMLRVEVTPTDQDDLFEVRITARGSRAALIRERSLTTLVYEPGLTEELEE